MSAQVHCSNAEIDKVIVALFAFMALVVVALLWFPELVAPAGGMNSPKVDDLIKMIR
jgi:hypothetical protein